MEAGGTQQPIGQTRQATVDALCEHFANDLLPVEEFERRVDAAHRAVSVEELNALLKDLPGGNLPAAPRAAPAPRPAHRVTAAAHVKERGIVVAIMGGAVRRGRWTPARRNYSFAVMGGTELDFREALLGPGVTDVQVFALMGGTEIIVPPGINVESHGVGIMGGFDHLTDIEETGADAPTLRITGLAVMGGVEITVRYPGESARDAKRRRRIEQKELRRLGRGEHDA